MKNLTPRTWLVLFIVLGLTIVGAIVLTVGGGSSHDGAAATSDPGTATVVSDSVPGSGDTLTTSAPTEPSTSTTTSTTVAPATTKAPAPKPSILPGTYSACYTASLASINELRASVPVAPLAPGSMSRACAWALHLAQVGALSHNAPGCNGGQVVGYTWHSAPGGQSNGPAEVINGWFNSPPHHANLIMPIYSTIGLAFVMRTSADGAWAVYGVGNLCP